RPASCWRDPGARTRIPGSPFKRISITPIPPAAYYDSQGQHPRFGEQPGGVPMKNVWLKTLPLLALAALPSHAIIGLGAHLAPAYGPEVKASNGPIMPAGSAAANRVSLMTGGASG